MKHRLRLKAVISGMLLTCAPFAQTQILTLQQALDLARKRAPGILAARDRIDEARGRLVGARIPLRENPVLNISAGPRHLPGNTVTDYEFGASQSFELGGRRGSRIASAQAALDRETASSQNTARELLRDVATAFWLAVAASNRVTLAKSASDTATELLRATQRRYDVGDIPILDVNIARNTTARRRLELRAAEADEIATLGALRVLLGMTPNEMIAVSGSLTDHPRYQPDELIAEASNRADLRALAAELREAEAEVRLGKGLAWPDVGLGASHGRDEGNLITKGALTFTLPMFSHGQELRITNEARATRLRRELAAGRQAVMNEVKTGLDVYERKMRAADELARDAIQSLDENETLARRSYEEGEMNLLDLLLIRRDAYETRIVYLNQLLEAKLAAVDLEARAGVLK